MPYITTFPNSNSNHFFVENPIRVRMEAVNNPVRSSYATLRISRANQEIFTYRGSFYQDVCEFNISDSVKGLVDVKITNTVWMDFYPNSVKSITVQGTYYDADDNLQYQSNTNIYIHAGGISNDLFRELLQRPERDIFGAKIYKKDSRKILTNRINIYVTMEELKSCPFSLWSYARGSTACDVRIYCGTRTFSSPLPVISNPYTLTNIPLFDIFNQLMANFSEDELRNQKVFFELTDNLTGSGYSQIAQLFYLAVPQQTKNSRILLFRNSWGVFEAIEVNGMFTGEIESESETIMVYDYDTDSYIEKEDERAGIRTVFRGETAFVNNDRLAFMRDFYSSKEVYLLQETGKMEKVILTDKNQPFYHDERKLSSLPVNFYLAQTETKYTVIEDINLDPYILITPPVVYAQDEPETYQILVETNGSFTLESDADWLDFDPEQGIGNTLINVNVSENTNSSSRQGRVRAALNSGDLNSEASFIQEAKKELSVDVDSINLSIENNYTATFNIISNRSWKLTGDRLDFSPSEGEGNATIQVSCLAPTGREDYISDIVVQDAGSDLYVILPYTIKGHALIFEFSTREVTVEYSATQYIIKGRANTKGLYIGASRLQYGDLLGAYYQVNGIDVRNGEYITGDPGATSTYEFTIPITFLENDSDQVRERILTLQEAYNLTTSDTMTILQLAENEQSYLNINPQEFIFPNRLPVEQQDLNISSNINTYIEYNSQLIEFNPNIGDGDWISKVKVIMDHTGYQERAILATIKSNGITPPIQLNITSKQAGRTPFMTPEQSSYDIFDTGGWLLIKGTGNFPNPHFTYGDNISEQNILIPDRYYVNGQEVYDQSNIPEAAYNQYEWEIEIEVRRLYSSNREYKLLITDAQFPDLVTPVTITINRLQMPASLSVSPGSLTFEAEGATSFIQVTTNDQYEIVGLLPEEGYTGSSYWDDTDHSRGKIYFNYSGDPSNGTIEVITDANTLFDVKNKTITIRGKVSRIESDVHLSQLGAQESYIINSYEDLDRLRVAINTRTESTLIASAPDGGGLAGYTVLMENDVDFENQQFAGIGTYSSASSYNAFKGIFDGGGHSILNFNIINPTGTSARGLFIVIEDAEIKNLTITGDINLPSATARIGLIAPWASGHCKFTNIVNKCNVTSGYWVCWMYNENMGNNRVIEATDCINFGNFTCLSNGTPYLMAPLGGATTVSVRATRFVNFGNMTVNNNVQSGRCAGIAVGQFLTLDSCYNAGKISGTNVSNQNTFACGIAGHHLHIAGGTADFNDCYDLGQVTGNAGNIGLITKPSSAGSQTNNYYNSDTLTPTTGYDGQGKTTAELKSGDLFNSDNYLEVPGKYPVIPFNAQDQYAALDSLGL